MRRQVLVSILLLISTASFARAGDLSAFAFSGLVWDDTSIYKPGELIVRFSGTDRPPAPSGAGAPIVGPLTKRAVRSKISDYIVSGASVHKEYDRIVPGLTLVKLPEGTSVLDALIRFNRSANILYAEPNYKIRALQPVIPNDPRFREQWGLNNTGQTGGIPDADIDAPEAWEIETSASNIIVAVLDTGINYTHPDLAANMWINPGEVSQPGVVGPNDFNNVDDDGNGYVDDIYGYDFVDDDGDPNDENFHGTHVAGIIGAVGDNGIGVAGVCWRVKLMAVRILDADGRGTIVLTMLSQWM
jgi:subtilisin family serine protease